MRPASRQSLDMFSVQILFIKIQVSGAREQELSTINLIKIPSMTDGKTCFVIKGLVGKVSFLLLHLVLNIKFSFELYVSLMKLQEKFRHHRLALLVYVELELFVEHSLLSSETFQWFFDVF